jgi:hypothetical protein
LDEVLNTAMMCRPPAALNRLRASPAEPSAESSAYNPWGSLRKL